MEEEMIRKGPCRSCRSGSWLVEARPKGMRGGVPHSYIFCPPCLARIKGQRDRPKRGNGNRHDSRPEAIAKRFWEKVKKTEGCWTWTAHTIGNGYGMFVVRYNVKRVVAHRFSWELVNGPIPDGMLVLHKCDNPPCVRPDHLFLGTQQDNMRDKVAKGRHHRELPMLRKLTGAQIEEIRTRYTGKWGEQTALAREYGVSQSTIHHLVKGLS